MQASPQNVAPDLDIVQRVGSSVGRIDTVSSELMRLAEKAPDAEKDYLLCLALELRIESKAIADAVAPPWQAPDYDRLMRLAREHEAYIAEHSTAPKTAAA